MPLDRSRLPPVSVHVRLRQKEKGRWEISSRNRSRLADSLQEKVGWVSSPFFPVIPFHHGGGSRPIGRPEPHRDVELLSLSSPFPRIRSRTPDAQSCRPAGES